VELSYILHFLSWGGHRQNEKATICRFCRIFVAFLGTVKKLQKGNEKATDCRYFVAFLSVFSIFFIIFMVSSCRKSSFQEIFFGFYVNWNSYSGLFVNYSEVLLVSYWNDKKLL